MMRGTADAAWQLPAMTNTDNLFACLRCRSFAEGPKLLPRDPQRLLLRLQCPSLPRAGDSSAERVRAHGDIPRRYSRGTARLRERRKLEPAAQGFDVTPKGRELICG